MSTQRFEKRQESCRRLPQGKFNRLRQMFDKKDNRFSLQTPTGQSFIIEDDEEEAQAETYEDKNEFLNKIFDGVSNDTNSLLSTLCSNNNQIADFLVSTTETSSSNVSNKSSSLKSVSTSTTGSINNKLAEVSLKNDSAEWFQAIPIFNMYDETDGKIETSSVQNEINFRDSEYTEKADEDVIDFRWVYFFF